MKPQHLGNDIFVEFDNYSRVILSHRQRSIVLDPHVLQAFLRYLETIKLDVGFEEISMKQNTGHFIAEMYEEAAKYHAQYLHDAMHSNADNFKAQLFRLIQKADKPNRARLELAFPIEVRVFKEWEASDEKDFWCRYGVPHDFLLGKDDEK